MIVIDMDMPKCCGTCEMSGTGVCKEWIGLIGYEMGKKRADTCPIKCDIEDIKAQIQRLPYQEIFESVSRQAIVDVTLEIIDNHISRKEKEGDHE